MKTTLTRILQLSLARYVLIGITVYAIELVVIIVAQNMGHSAVVAVGVSFWLGLLISFALQKVVTFRDRRTHHKILLPQVAAFSLLVFFNFGFTILLTDVLSPALSPTITRTIALGITTLWNFYLYKTKIFKKSSNPAIY